MSEKDKILIVEDEPDTRFILKRLLAKNGYVVKAAENGKAALAVIEEYHPKVIVADWTMPVMDGLELCNTLKNHENYKSIYYIMLTARVSVSDRVKGLDVGADDFLIKPVENEELLARIRAGVRIYNLQNELKLIEHGRAIIEMATTIGHQINNPLSSLFMSLQNLKDEMSSTENKNALEDIQIMEESLQRIKKLTESLTELDKPEFVEYTLNKKMLKLK